MNTLGLGFIRHTLKRYKDDERGNIALIFGSVFVIIIACIGAGYDMNQLVSTKQKASSIADTAVLTAAVYYSTHGEPPQSLSDGLVHNHEYDASDLNYTFNSLSSKMAEDVKIKVTYDTVNKEATAEVYGHTKVAFMQVFGHQKLDFKAVAVAKFSEVELANPASIIMVLDNSGSMWFDDLPNDPDTGANPSEAGKRITALKSGVNSLMSSLNTVAGPQTEPGERFLRTGMVTYASSVLNGPGASSVPMKWGTLSTSEVNAMVPGGGTNSDPPMAAAKIVLDTEDIIHLAEHGDDPLKFLIFMTDGQNNNTNTLWENASGTGYWRRWEEEPGYWKEVCFFIWCWDEWVPGSSDWVYEESDDEPAGGGWAEGLFTGDLDNLTRATCDLLRADGVHVYSIGFALESGTFDTNDWANYGNPDTWPVDSDVKRAAVFMMQQCSGTEYPQRFTYAGDSTALEEAFEQIGTQIVTEVIRLKS